MAFGRLSGKEGSPPPMHAINVTPLVDVMLVLVVIFILAAPMLAASLRERLAQLGARNPQAELQLRADQAVPYGRVAELMGWAHAAGLTRIGFVAEPAPSRKDKAGAVLGPTRPGR
jgi:biopolymer transport protein ExbD/biopolymer transport protein TolR